MCNGIIHNTSKNDGKTKISTVLDRNIKRGRSQSNDKTICVKLVKLKNNSMRKDENDDAQKQLTPQSPEACFRSIPFALNVR
jgi:hypothetical protein